MKSRSTIVIDEECINNLKTKIIGKNFHHFETVDSTNIYAKKLINEDISEGTVVISEVQTTGRGRKNRKWLSSKGGLWFSIILYPDMSPEKCMLITMAASVSLVQSIKESTDLNCEIKWPNDILIKGKKVSGILTEVDIKNNKLNYVIIGIGINVNNLLEKEIQNVATTLKIEKNSVVLRFNVFKHFLINFDKFYQIIINKDYDTIRKIWLTYANIIDRNIQLIDSKNKIFGNVTNIDENGYLILKTDGGILKIVSGDLNYL